MEWGLVTPGQLPSGSWTSFVRGPIAAVGAMSALAERDVSHPDGSVSTETARLTVDAGTGELRYATYMTSRPTPWLGRSAPSALPGPNHLTAQALAPTAAPRSVESAAVISASVFALWLAVYFYPLLKYASAQGLGFVPGYAKLRKDRLLDHRLRDELVHIIRQDPGLSATEIANRVDAGWSTVVYHLGVIEKNGLVTSLVDTRHRRFFPVGEIPHGDRARIAVLRNARTRQVLDLVLEAPGSSQVDLGRRVGVSRPAVAWHLKRLERHGYVVRAKKGRSVQVFPSAAAAAAQPGDAPVRGEAA